MNKVLDSDVGQELINDLLKKRGLRIPLLLLLRDEAPYGE